MDDLNNVQFVQQLRAGDQNAFTVLFDRLSPKLCAFIARFGVSNHDAEELAADTMYKVHKALQKFNPAGGAKLTTWIFEIAKNVTIDHLRQRALLAKNTPEEFQTPVPDEDAGDGQSLKRKQEPFVNGSYGNDGHEEDSPPVLRLVKALNSLSEDDQDIIRLRNLMSYEEISQSLDAKVGALRTRHSRAVERLKMAYEQEKDYER